jgi:prepilin-type N-terminal cleavage/methylation domain-containing protein
MRVQRRTSRPAFTLVEMMVAMALCLFIMAIISQAFGAATKTFSTMRTAGQMQDKLRMGTSIIRRDLAASHFDGPFVAGRNGPRVGDQRLDQVGYVPPKKGFFQILQGGPSILEPLVNPQFDGEQLASSRATNHSLRFTVLLPELPAADLFCAEAPPNTGPGSPGAVIQSMSAFNTGQPVFYGRWAEIALFLWGNPPDAASTPAGVPRYSLRRRVRLLAPTTVVVAQFPTGQQGQQAAQQLIASYPDLALAPIVEQPLPLPAPVINVKFLGPEDVTNPSLRLPLPTSPVQKLVNGNMVETGDDILMTDVVSFEVKVAWASNLAFNTNGIGLLGSSPDARPMFLAAAPGVTVNSDAPFDDLPPSVLNNAPPYAGQRVFDTWYQGPGTDSIDWDRANTAAGVGGGRGFLTPDQFQPPLRINVRALQIKIRVWDERAEQTRQVTMIQDI